MIGEHTMLKRKKAATSSLASLSLTSPTSPTLANPTRGFGLQTDTVPASTNQESSNQHSSQPDREQLSKEAFQQPSVGHDISRISMRPQAKLSASEPGQELIADKLTHVVPETSSAGADLQTKVIQRTLYTKGDPKGVKVPPAATKVAAQVGSAKSIKVKVGKKSLPGIDIGGVQYVGDRPYGNRSGDLPSGVTYKEYDTHPYTGKNRGTDRIVIGSDGKKYYTDDHYTNFTEF
jgi:guanyl-specific ribonuclease Sa